MGSVVKAVSFVTRHPSLDVEDFHARWRSFSTEMLAANPSTEGRLQRATRHHRLARDYERLDTPYDGVSVHWYESLDALRAMAGDPRFSPVRDAEAELFDLDRTLTVLTHEEAEVMPGPARREPPMTVLCAGVRRKPGMDIEEFHRYWWEVHGPLNRDTPEVAQYLVRYEQNHRLESDYARESCDLDGVTIEWFATTRDFFGMAMDKVCQEVLMPDEKRFLDRDRLVWILTSFEET